MTISSYSNSTFSYRDDSGQDISVRNPTEEQKTLLMEICENQDERWTNPEYDLHDLLHSAPEYEKGMGGYVYSELLKKWAKDKPQVKSFKFDDAMFMGSVGFIIPSMNKYEHMGVNVILCPQCGDIFEFFCYPNHLESLLAAFGVAQKELLAVPASDNSSPRFLKEQTLKEKLLNTISNP